MQSEKNIMSMKGITLIALVVTIVVLLILAGISISMLTGEEGIVKQAANAKEKNEIAQEKEYVSLATTEAYRLSEGSRLESMQNALDGYAGKDKTIVYEDDEFLVQFIESNRYYQVDENGDIYEYITYEDTTLGELEEDTITKDGE